VSQYVRAAVNASGGVDVVSGGAFSVLCLSLHEEMRPLEKEVTSLESDRDRQVTFGVPADSPGVKALGTRIQQALDRWIHARASRANQKKVQAIALVNDALAGSEAARSELERLARAYPHEFRNGLADGLAGARLDRVLVAKLTEVLTE
jgi:hypothetical protein